MVQIGFRRFENFDLPLSAYEKVTFADIGHLSARDDPTIRIGKCVDELRLSRPFRPLRSLRL